MTTTGKRSIFQLSMHKFAQPRGLSRSPHLSSSGTFNCFSLSSRILLFLGVQYSLLLCLRAFSHCSFASEPSPLPRRFPFSSELSPLPWRFFFLFLGASSYLCSFSSEPSPFPQRFSFPSETLLIFAPFPQSLLLFLGGSPFPRRLSNQSSCTKLHSQDGLMGHYTLVAPLGHYTLVALV
jgi:hypothetical protein